jgi:hypothetical protein
LKDIINSLQPPESKIQWLLIKNTSAELINTIREQLYSTRQDKVSIDDSLRALQHAHKKIITTENKQASNKSACKTQENDCDKNEHRIKKSKEDLALLPHEVKLGTWFEVYNGENRTRRRLKLSIILYDNGSLIFVDRRGNKAMEIHASVFLHELNNNQSRILVDQSICHHALNKVICMLSKK